MPLRQNPGSRRQMRAAGIEPAAPPSARLKSLFALCFEITRAGDGALAASGPARLATQEQFERTIFLRAINTLKAASVVAGAGHWEIASGCARQIYELLLNMEFIAEQESRETASLAFARFGMLQRVLGEIAEIKYDRDTGRSHDVVRLTALENHASSSPLFYDFQVKKKDKPVRWRRSWNGMSAWDMAQQSPNALRAPQYRLLYKRWSEEAHGAPGAHIDNLFLRNGEDWAQKAINQDLVETVRVMQMAMSLHLELWHLLASTVPLASDQAGEWTSRLSEDFLEESRRTRRHSLRKLFR